jgi:hypothetical protein
MLLGSQHYKGVEGRVGAPRWDYEEMTNFNHSHEPAQNQHKTHHGPDLGEATTFPLIVYFVPLHGGHIQMVFCPGTRNSHSWGSCNFEGI